MKTLLTLTQSKLKKCLKKHFKNYKTISGEGFLYVHQNNNVPCLVAHLDTISDKMPKAADIIEHKNILFLNPASDKNIKCLGADDRAGIYALLKLAKTGYNLLFTEDEESGGKGVNKLCNSEHLEFIVNHATCFIEFDKSGFMQFCPYYSENENLQNIILKTGQKEIYGSYSDIVDLTDYSDLASVNICCGYYQEHTRGEYLKLNELKKVIKIFKSKKLFKSLCADVFIDDNFYKWNSKTDFTSDDDDDQNDWNESFYSEDYNNNYYDNLAELYNSKIHDIPVSQNLPEDF